MASINTSRPTNTPAAYTFNGAKAVTFDHKKELERSVLSTMLWEDSYYESGVEIAKRIADLVQKNNVEDVVEIALRTKFEAKLRHVPLFLVRELFRKKEARLAAGTILQGIATRPDDMMEFLALWWKNNKDEPLANQAKKALANAILKFSAYDLKKYKKSNNTITLRDVFRLVHPKPKTQEQKDLWKALVTEELGSADTWESALSSGADKKETFERLTKEKKLGSLAALRNLRNMRESGMSVEDIKKVINNIESSKLFPMQVISAWRHNPQFTSELNDLFMKLFATREKVKGSTAILVDVSGSMVGAKVSARSELDRRDAASALAAVAREMFDDVDVYVFREDCKQIPAFNGLALIEKICAQPSGGTNIGHAVNTAFKTRNYERIVVITDEQSSDSVTLPKGAKGYMMNVAQHRNGIGYGNWVRIDGWSENVLDYIVEFEKL